MADIYTQLVSKIKLKDLEEYNQAVYILDCLVDASNSDDFVRLIDSLGQLIEEYENENVSEL